MVRLQVRPREEASVENPKPRGGQSNAAEQSRSEAVRSFIVLVGNGTECAPKVGDEEEDESEHEDEQVRRP